jgi:hypothetical protein
LEKGRLLKQISVLMIVLLASFLWTAGFISRAALDQATTSVHASGTDQTSDLSSSNVLPPPCFYFLPSSQSYYTFNEPTSFTETLSVATTGDTYTYQYEVDYDPTVLNCTGAAYTSPPTSQFFKGHTTAATGPDLSTQGKISGRETLLGSDVVHANTAGASIITMNFTIIGSPLIGQSLTSFITLSPVNTFLLDPNLDTVPNVSLGNVTFTLSYAIGPVPSVLTVSPITQTFLSNRIWNETAFTEDVVLQNPPNSMVVNATTQLDYNNVLTRVTSVTFDPLWRTASWSEVTPGTLMFNVSSPTSVPSVTMGVSTMRIATINFTIIGQHSVPPEPFGYYDVSTLHFHNFQIGSNASSAYLGYIAGAEAMDGVVTVFAAVHDVAVTAVVPFKTVVGQGYGLNVNVTAANQGAYTETFNVTVYANTTYVTSQNVTLPSATSTTLALTCNTTGLAYGNYTTSAYAWLASGQTNASNNNYTGGWVIVSLVGDVYGPNGWPDGKVNMLDIGAIARAFGTTTGNPRYNPNYDINGDGKIDMKDIAIAAKNFGQHYP